MAQFLMYLMYSTTEPQCRVYIEQHAKMKRVGNLEKFGLIYGRLMKYIYNAIRKTESRLVFTSTREPLMSRLYVYKTLFRTVFNQYFENDYAILEASGIFQKIRQMYDAIHYNESSRSITTMLRQQRRSGIQKFVQSLQRITFGEVNYNFFAKKLNLLAFQTYT